MRRKCEYCGRSELSGQELLLRDSVRAKKGMGVAEVVKQFGWTRARSATMLLRLVRVNELRRRIIPSTNKMRPQRWFYF